MVVWRLDRWGRSLLDLVATLQELASLDVGFVSLSEALDLTTPSGRALAGMLAVFAEFERDILRDRVKAGIDPARKEGRPHGRPHFRFGCVFGAGIRFGPCWQQPVRPSLRIPNSAAMGSSNEFPEPS